MQGVVEEDQKDGQKLIRYDHRQVSIQDDESGMQHIGSRRLIVPLRHVFRMLEEYERHEEVLMKLMLMTSAA